MSTVWKVFHNNEYIAAENTIPLFA